MQGAEVLTKFTADTTQMDKATKDLSSTLESTKKQGELAFLGLTVAVDAFTASIIKGGIEYNAQMQTFNTRLTTLTGTAEGADKVLSQIKKDALATPFDVASLTQAESLLLSTGISAEDARGDILALGDAISASGGGNAELQRMAVNMQQIKNVGKASSLDIKQFAYAGIDIYGLLADSMGITREEAADLDVTYEMLSTALKKASSEGGKYYGAMKNQSKTYNGAMSNLSESIDVLKGKLSEGLFNSIAKLIPKLTELFDWLGKNSDIIVSIAVPLLTFINLLAGMMIVTKVASALSAMFTVLAANPIMLVVAAIGALVAGFVILWNKSEAFRNFWKGLWAEFKPPVMELVNSLKDLWNNVILPIGKLIWSYWGPKLKDTFTTIKNLFFIVAEGIKTRVQTLISVFSGIVEFLTGVFSGNWSKAWSGIKKAFTSYVSGLGKALKTPLNVCIELLNSFIRKINRIKAPDWVPMLGGKGVNIPLIPKLKTGTNIVPNDMLAQLHEGEAVIPKKFNPYVNPIRNNTVGSMLASTPGSNITIHNSMEFDALGQLVNNVKTFSGGAKNDYNYVGGY